MNDADKERFHDGMRAALNSLRLARAAAQKGDVDDAMDWIRMAACHRKIAKWFLRDAQPSRLVRYTRGAGWRWEGPNGWTWSDYPRLRGL